MAMHVTVDSVFLFLWAPLKCAMTEDLTQMVMLSDERRRFGPRSKAWKNRNCVAKPKYFAHPSSTELHLFPAFTSELWLSCSSELSLLVLKSILAVRQPQSYFSYHMLL